MGGAWRLCAKTKGPQNSEVHKCGLRKKPERSLALTQAFGLDRMSDSQQLATPIPMLVGALSCQLRAVSSLSAAV